MKIYKELKQGTDEWFGVRLGKFTASHAQAIGNNGRGLTTLIMENVAEILTGKMKDQYTNADIERGNELESMARSFYEVQTGNIVQEVGFVELDEHTGCSPDGLVGDDGLLEIKCINNTKFVYMLLYSKVDPKYMWQMQMQMHVTGRKWCDYVVYNPNFKDPLIIKRVKRDDEKIEQIKVGLENGVKKLKEVLDKIRQNNARYKK